MRICIPFSNINILPNQIWLKIFDLVVNKIYVVTYQHGVAEVLSSYEKKTDLPDLACGRRADYKRAKIIT